MSNKIEKQVFEFIFPIVEELGYELACVEFRKVNAEKNLTVVICSPAGISLEDCEKVHNAIDIPLDELDPTAGEPYVLNVSSFGLDRAFKTQRDFERNYGKNVEIKFFTPINGKKMVVGELVNCDENYITVKINDKETKFDLKGISKVSSEIVF